MSALGWKQPSSGPLNVKTAPSWRGIVPFTHLAREGRMTVTIGRRELLAALGGAAAAWPLAAPASSTAHRGNRASLWNWLELQFVGGRIDEPEFGVGLLRNRSAEKREVFVGVRPVLPIAHSADRISDLIAEAILQR